MLGLGLAAVWIVGIATRQPIWISWFNFLFAVACLAVAVMALGRGRVQLESRA